MLYTLKNQELTVQVSDMGAELHSVKRGDCEYIWVGDPAFWNCQAPLVFPVCGRFQDGKYDCDGKTYEIGCHGFARDTRFEMISHTDTALCLRLSDSEETRAMYPFPFVLDLWYILEGDKLTTRFDVKNPGDKILPVALGGHPGFNVPLNGEGEFEDYYLEFSKPCYPDRFELSERYLFTGNRYAYYLEDARILRLRHDHFDFDAIFMSRVASEVTLKSDRSERSVTLIYPDMPYLGVWHCPGKPAPYVCIEPFAGLPGLDGVREDLATRNDTVRILPGRSHTAEFAMIFR